MSDILQPFWLSADLQSLEVSGTQLGSLAASVQDHIDGLVAPVEENATKAKEMEARLRSWYDERLAETTQPAADVAATAASFLNDVWTSGVHVFIPYPDWGGFAYLKSALTEAIGRTSDDNRPMFGDDLYAGGILIMVAGGKVPVLSAVAAMAALFGGDAKAVIDSLGEALITSPPLASLGSAFMELAGAPGQVLSETASELQTWYDGSAFGRIAKEGFPGSIFQDRSQPPAPIEPEEVPEKQSVNFTLRGKFDRYLQIKFDGAFLPPYYQTTSEIRVSVPGRLLRAGERMFTGFTVDGAGTPGAESSLGVVRVIAVNPLDMLGQIEKGPVFDTWRALTVGQPVGALFPGAQSLLSQTMNALDTVGQLTTDTGNAVSYGLHLAGNAITAGMGGVAGVTEDLGAAAGSLVADLTKVSASVLLVPPGKGGIHQLSFALSQGLSEYALGAPLVDDEQVVGAVFLCAGSATRDEAMASLKRFGAAFGVPALANL